MDAAPSGRLLIVDDDAELLENLAKILAGLIFEVDTGERAYKATARAEEAGAFDVVNKSVDLERLFACVKAAAQ
jgi:DNA-binding NtrC family response regulator